MSDDEEISFHKLYPKADNAMRALTMTRAKMELQKSRIPLSQKQLPVNTSLKSWSRHKIFTETRQSKQYKFYIDSCKKIKQKHVFDKKGLQ